MVGAFRQIAIKALILYRLKAFAHQLINASNVSISSNSNQALSYVVKCLGCNILSLCDFCDVLICENVACPFNQYNDGSSSYCKACPANSGHRIIGSTSVSDCKCFKGYVGSPQHGLSCTGENFVNTHHFFVPLFSVYKSDKKF